MSAICSNLDQPKILSSGNGLKCHIKEGISLKKKKTHGIILRYREYVYSVAVYQKYLTRLRELIIFEPWREKYHFSQPS